MSGNKVYYQDITRKYLRTKAENDFNANKAWFEVINELISYDKVKNEMIEEYKRKQIKSQEAKEAEKRKKDQEKLIEKEIKEKTEKAIEEAFGDLFKSVN